MATASDLMAEVTREYELCMSALVFDSNMMNEANIQVHYRRCPPSPSAPDGHLCRKDYTGIEYGG